RSFAMSVLPSPSKSPVATSGYSLQVPLARIATRLTGPFTEKKITFETPPPGAGLETVIDTVPMVATSEAGIDAVNCALLTNVVDRGLPFQFTTDVGANPAPLIVIVNPAEPGATPVGKSGKSM